MWQPEYDDGSEHQLSSRNAIKNTSRVLHPIFQEPTLICFALVLFIFGVLFPTSSFAAHYYFPTKTTAQTACNAELNANYALNPHQTSQCVDQGIQLSIVLENYNPVVGNTPIDYFWYSPAPPYPNENLGPPPSCGVGNPCDPGTGNKFQTETDEAGTNSALSIIRYYNSQGPRDVGLGVGWSSSLWGKHLEIKSTSTVWVLRPDGRGEIFNNCNTACTGGLDTHFVLAKNSGGYTLTSKQNATVESYDTTGKLLSETDSAGKTTTYSYSANSITITDHFGHTSTFGLDATNHVSTVTDAAGNIIQYGYDAAHNLISVSYPDGTGKLYHYEDGAFPYYLTGISDVDANQVVQRYATYGYDDVLGKAASTQHAGGIEYFSLTYDASYQTTVKDAVNTAQVLTFQEIQAVKSLTSKINQADGKSLVQKFDGYNNLTCKKDEEGRVTTYTYNTPNIQRLSMTEGRGGNCTTPTTIAGVTRTITYQYLSPTLDLLRFIRRPSVAAGQTFETELVYGDAGHPNLPTQITQRGFTPSNASVLRTVGLSYNASGQVNSINGSRSPSDPGMNGADDVTTLEYYVCTTGRECGQLKKGTNALGHITTYDLYDANGRLLQMTDPNGLRTNYTYDARGRVKTVTQTPASGPAALTQYSYTPWGDVAQVIDPDGVVLNYQYDAAHYLRYIVDGAGNYIHYAYDLKGNRTADDSYDSSGALMRTVGYSYDLRDHLTSITSAGNVTQIVHDAVGNLLSESPNADGVNRTMTHQYDALNRLFKTMDAVNGAAAPTLFGYDINDRVNQVTAPNNLSTQYSYDDLGNLLQEISPDRGTTSYTYDTAGNLLTVTNGKGQVTTYTYDALNRVATKQSSDANTPRYAFVYDTLCGKGRLCTISRNGSGELLLRYDGLGRLNYKLDLNTGLVYTAAYSPAGRLTHLTYPSGRTVDYTHDALGQVNQVSTTANGNTTLLASNIQHYSFGPLSALTFGNGRSFSTARDTAYRETVRFDGPYYQYINGYDGADNLLSIAGGGSRTFTYDALNRLSTANDTRSGAYGSLSYLYDGNGNRGRETRNGIPADYFYAVNANFLSQVGDTDYRLADAAGNTRWSTAWWVIGYDGYGRLISSSKAGVSYGYNAFDQRTKKTVGGVSTTFLQDREGRLLYETDGAHSKAYVYLNGVPLARIDDDTSIYYYHTDHLGTPQVMTNGAGATVWKANYEPFGSATVTVSTVINSLRLPGQYFDAETGLHYNWHRYYDPKVGRYISSDPIGLKGGLNTYAYVENNPLRWTDPLGLAKFCCRLLDSKIVGGILRQRHCYIIADDGTRYGLYPENGRGVPRTNDPRDKGGECFDCPAIECTDQNKCLRKAHNAYPIGDYSAVGGPNSNTYAGTLARSCCKGGVPAGVHDAPRINDNPPTSK